MKSLVIGGSGVRRDEAGRFCINDIHRAAGGEARHQPANWLRLEQTRALTAEIVASSDVRIPPISTKKGTGTHVCRELVYAYGMWISPPFHLAVIRAFDEFGVRNVPPPHTEAALSDPGTLQRLLLENVQARLRLEQTAASCVPKAAAYDRLTVQRGAVSLRAAAKTLGITPNHFFRWLSVEKWIYRSADHGSWLGYQRQVEAGYLVHRLHPIEHSPGYQRIHPQVRVTARGIAKLSLMLEASANTSVRIHP